MEASQLERREQIAAEKEKDWPLYWVSGISLVVNRNRFSVASKSKFHLKVIKDGSIILVVI